MASAAHDELVQRAGKWLANTRKCVLTLEEANCWAINEFPDAIGWTVDGYSILVECKVSVTDFRKDAHKPSKHMAKARGAETMGRERWYLTPAGLLTPEMLPEGYGLLEAHAKSLRRVVEAATGERPGREQAELPLLLRTVRKEAWAAGYNGRMVRLRAEGSRRVKCGGCGRRWRERNGRCVYCAWARPERTADDDALLLDP